jgi:hypothetical protein
MFPGDSNEKIRTRIQAYLECVRSVGLTAFREGHHVILGGNGGDIPVLRGFGIPDEQIHVAEWHLPTSRKLKKAYPEVFVYEGDILGLASRLWGTHVVTANLDFCGRLGEELACRAAGVIRLTLPQVAMVTVCGSREQESEFMFRLLAIPNLSEEKALQRGQLVNVLLNERAGIQLDPGLNISYEGTGLRMSTSLHGNVLPYSEVLGSQFDERAMALEMRQIGLVSRDIAPMFGYKRQFIANWFAEDTIKKRKENP